MPGVVLTWVEGHAVETYSVGTLHAPAWSVMVDKRPVCDRAGRPRRYQSRMHAHEGAVRWVIQHCE